MPGVSQDIFLLHSERELDLLHDIELINFFEQSKKGGVSYVCTRKIDVQGRPDTSIVYIDLNNRKSFGFYDFFFKVFLKSDFSEYGSSQMMPLPSSDFFTYDNPQEFMKKDIWRNWHHDSEFGYFLEVRNVYRLIFSH